MRKIEKLHVRKSWVPNWLIHIKGYLHANKGLISIENETIRSPYLLERRFSYAEYREKLLKEVEKTIQPMNKELFKTEVEKKLEVEKLEIIQNKLSKLENPCSGTECRLKMQLERNRESIELKIAELDAKMQEVDENIQLTKQLAHHLLEQNLSLLQSKAYIYILGADGKIKSSKHYLDVNDVARDVFSDLLPSTI